MSTEIEPAQPSSQRAPVMRRLVDLTQKSPRRKSLTHGLVTFGDGVPFTAAVLALIASLRGIPAQTPWVLAVGALFIAYSVGTKIFKSYLDRRKEELKAEQESELKLRITELETQLVQAEERILDVAVEAAAEGSAVVLEHWSTVAQLHEDGTEKAHRQLQEGMHFDPEQRVGTEAVHAYLRAINAVFEAFYEAHEGGFSTNLTVPNSAHTLLWLVAIEPGGKNRSNKIPREIDLSNDVWGAAVAFNNQSLIYTANVCDHGNAGNRGYLSVVNIPVLNSAGDVAAILNVDSPHIGAFGSEDRVNGVLDYCRPILASLSLCLSDPRLFREQRL